MADRDWRSIVCPCEGPVVDPSRVLARERWESRGWMDRMRAGPDASWGWLGGTPEAREAYARGWKAAAAAEGARRRAELVRDSAERGAGR